MMADAQLARGLHRQAWPASRSGIRGRAGRGIMSQFPVKRMRGYVRRAILLSQWTTIGLEEAFWDALKEIAATRNTSLQDLLREIDKDRQHSNRSSLIRVFVLDCYRERR